jgi:colanic acid biosynthesis glycosyl transferase WcaI
MRIAILNQFFPPDLSPTAHLAASLAAHRANLGDTVTVIAGRGGYVSRNPAFPDAHVSDGDDGAAAEGGRRVRVKRIWTPKLGKASGLKRVVDYLTFLFGALTRVLVLRRQDVIVALTTPPYLVVVALAHKLLRRRTRVVLWSMDVYPDAAERLGALRPGGVTSRTLRALNQRLYRRLDHVVALDGAMADLLASEFAGDEGRDRISVIPNWEAAALYPSADAVERADHGLARGAPALDPFVVLYLGNLGVGHHIDTVVEAAVKLAGEPVAFRFVGGGARWDELASAVKLRGLDNVEQVGYVPKSETPALMARAGAALILLDDRSLGVMSPSKLHASLAMGLPVVYLGPRGSNVDEAVERFQCGDSLRGDDVEGLVTAIRRLRDDAEHAAELRRRARHAFETAYSDDQVLPQFDAVIEDRTPRRS